MVIGCELLLLFNYHRFQEKSHQYKKHVFGKNLESWVIDGWRNATPETQISHYKVLSTPQGTAGCLGAQLTIVGGETFIVASLAEFLLPTTKFFYLVTFKWERSKGAGDVMFAHLPLECSTWPTSCRSYITFAEAILGIPCGSLRR